MPSENVPEDEVLDRRLVRSAAGLQEPRQDVEGNGHRLEADEDGHELDAARHEHHAERGAQHEEVVLAGARALDLQVALRDQDRHRRGGEEDGLEEDGEPVDGDEAARRGRRQADERREGERSGAQHRHRQPGQPRVALLWRRRLQHQDEQQAGRQDQLGQDVPEVGERQSWRHLSACLRGRAPGRAPEPEENRRRRRRRPS